MIRIILSTTRRTPKTTTVEVLSPQTRVLSTQPLLDEDYDDRKSPPPPRTSRKAKFRPRRQRPIYVAATKQHVGKTSASISLVAGLQQRFAKVGFIKPVGQVHVPVKSSDLGKTISVDKDVCLVKEHFGLSHLDYRNMSPVLIPRGYTRDYLDGEICHDEQITSIRESFRAVNDASDVTLCEGTGHCAVGSVINLNNAKVAAMLGADMVLVANGGLGSTIDELELNRVLCEHHGVKIAGVIVNKVNPEKYYQTKRLLSKAMRQMWGIPLLGCVPDRPFLGCPALVDLERLYNTQLMCGHKHKMRHYAVQETNLVTTSARQFIENLRTKPSRTLYFCHSTRDDVIMAFLREHQRKISNGEPFESALVVCGRKEKYAISPQVHEITKGVDVPILPVQMSTHQAMNLMHNFTPKLNSDDKTRVNSTINHYCNYIDFDELLGQSTETSFSSFDTPCDFHLEALRRL